MIATASPSSTRAAGSSPDAGEIRTAVRRFIGARVSDAATADDLTQDVLLKVQERLPQVRDPRRLMGWVIRIARNQVTDFFRRARPMQVFEEQQVDDDALQPDALAREEDQLRTQLHHYIRSVVHALPPLYRDAIVLTDYEGLSQVELAQRHRISVSAAKSRVQRARALVHATINRCCRFDVDHYGTVIDYTSRSSACVCPPERQPATPRLS